MLKKLPLTKLLLGVLFTQILALLVLTPTLFILKGPQPFKSPESQKESKKVLGDYFSPGAGIYISGTNDAYSAGGMIAQASTDEAAVQIGGYQTTGQVTIDIYQASEDALISYLVHDKDGKQKNTQIDTSNFTFISSIKQNLVNLDYSGSRISLPISGKGIWYLKLKFNNQQIDSYLIRSDTGVLVKNGDDKFVFWGQNFQSKRNITSGTVHVYSLLDGKKELSSGTFDQDGVANANLVDGADVAVAEIGDDRAIVPINLQYLNYGYNSYQAFSPKQRHTRYFFFTDRPLYRPGDTVYFKTILRDDDDARYNLPGGSAIVKIFNGYPGSDNPPLFQKTVTISANGSIDGQYILPDSAKVGSYSISVEVPGSNIGNNYYYGGYYANDASFNVQFFRKPDQFINLTTTNTEYISGDKALLTVSGSYFSGQPIRNQKVDYKVYSADYYNYSYLVDANAQISDEYRYGYYYGDVVGQGQLTFDSKGQAQITVDTKLNGDGKSKVFSVEAQFDGGSGDPSFARKNVLVHAAEYGIYRQDYGYSSKIGSPINLPVVLKPFLGGKVNDVILFANIDRTTWIPYQDPNQKYTQYRQETKHYSPLKAVSDSQGNATFNFTPDQQGSYSIIVTGSDSRGNTTSNQFYVYVTDQDYGYYSQGSNGLTITPDKESYNPNETAHLQVYSDIPDRDVFLSMERGRLDRYKVLHLNGKSGVFDVPLVPNDLPNIYAQIGSFSNNNINSSIADLKLSTDSKDLKISITPNKAKFGPGEQINVNILTTDRAGNPLPAEVTFWSVDKALYELMSSNLGDIFQTFWSHRYNSTLQSHSLTGISVKSAEMGGGCFAAGTQILMADGSSKNIESVKVGDEILTRTSETDEKQVKAKVIGLHNQDVSGYLIINGNIKVTAYHIMFINGKWQEAGNAGVGDLLTDKDGRSVEVTSLEWQLGKFSVYNLEVDKYHTYFANGIWVHNQKGADTRTVFKDTAYWNPSIQTGSDGRAQVSYKLPDNLTTWVMTAVAANGNTQVGQTQAEITVSKDLIVRPVLPNILRVGDQAKLSALVQNFTDLDHKFDVNFKFDSGDVSQATISAVPIKAQDMVQEFWDVTATKPNPQAKLTFSAVENSSGSKKLADAIAQTIPVEEFGFLDKRAQTGDGQKDYQISIFPDSSPDKSTITLSLSPSLVGALPAAMRYLIDYPYGCVEQTTSRLVPVLLAKANPQLFSDFVGQKNLDDMIQTGLTRLKAQQHPDGGWTWYFNGDSDPFITSYATDYLLFARSLGVKVDDDILIGAKYYLTNQYTKDTPETLVARAYGRAVLGVTDKKIMITNFNGLTPDLLSIAVMANYLNGDHNSATNGLNQLQQLAQTQGDSVFWNAGANFHFGSKDASTAYAIRAILMAGGDRNLATKGVRFLTNDRVSDYWSNTFGTVQVMRAIIDFSKSENETTPNYSYSVKLDDKVIASGQVTDPKQKIKDINIPVKSINSKGSNLSVTKTGNGQIYSTLAIKEYRTDQKAAPVSHTLSIKREYINEKGIQYSMGVGDTIDVQLTVSGLKSDAKYAVIEDQLPAGLIPINEIFKNEQANQAPYDYGYYPYSFYDKEVTENGMILSLYSVPAYPQVYTYKARVVSEGKFVTPPAVASLMYQPEIYARSNAEIVTVDKEAKVIPGRLANPLFKRTGDLVSFVKDNTLLSSLIGVILGAIIGVLIVFREKVKVIVLKLRDLLRRDKTPPPSSPPPLSDPSSSGVKPL